MKRKKEKISTPTPFFSPHRYNEECRAIVMRYSSEWRATVRRIGRWIDFDNDYKTLDPHFMESVWWVFHKLHEKGLVYRGFKVMPFSTACGTPLSNFEAGLNYKDVADPAVMIAFPLVDDADAAAAVAWTTTPWTLPSNLALCVHPELTYVKAKCRASGKVFVVAEARLTALPGAAPKKKKKGAKDGDADADAAPEGGYDILATMPGSALVGKRYEPLFPFFSEMADPTHPDTPAGAFRILADAYVTADSGTGVVHCAPAFGEDDMRVCLEGGIVARGGALPCPVDDDGAFTAAVPAFAGRHVKDCDKDIVAAVKAEGRLVDAASIVHSYPFCWRSDTPLIYRAVPSWFVRVEAIKDRLLAANATTHWVPQYVKDKRCVWCWGGGVGKEEKSVFDRSIDFFLNPTIYPPPTTTASTTGLNPRATGPCPGPAFGARRCPCGPTPTAVKSWSSNQSPIWPKNRAPRPSPTCTATTSTASPSRPPLPARPPCAAWTTCSTAGLSPARCPTPKRTTRLARAGRKAA